MHIAHTLTWIYTQIIGIDTNVHTRTHKLDFILHSKQQALFSCPSSNSSLPREKFLLGQGEIFPWAEKNESGPRDEKITDHQSSNLILKYFYLSEISANYTKCIIYFTLCFIFKQLRTNYVSLRYK